MSMFWSLFIIVLTLVNLIGLVWLLIATARSGKSEKSLAETTGHVWDEDLSELNNPLPRWWLGMFILSFVFGAVYLVVYPGLGSWVGTSGWSSSGELRENLKAANARVEAIYSKFRDRPLEELQHDRAAQKIGQNIFVNTCSGCHGSDARGAKGYPNLADRDWLWGNQPESVLTSVRDGRQGIMPALGVALPDGGINQVASYVLSLSGQAHDARLATVGKSKFEALCSGCHGMDGHGNPTLGAPNLADRVWLYGGSQAMIEESITNGRSGKMPAWGVLLGEDRSRLVAAWVMAQSAAGPPIDPQATTP